MIELKTIIVQLEEENYKLKKIMKYKEQLEKVAQRASDCVNCSNSIILGSQNIEKESRNRKSRELF